MSNMNFPSLSHSVNSSGRLGMFVQPHSCPCVGCHNYLASQEPPGLSNFPPPPSALKLQRQTAMPHSEELSAEFSPLSHNSSLPSPIAPVLLPSPPSLPKRTNGGGITPPPSLEASPTGLGNWRALFEEFRDSRWDASEEATAEHGLCDCTGVHEEPGMSVDLKNEIAEHLTQYLTMLEKHQKVMAAKMDLYAFLLEDASVRLRLESFNKKINSLKATLEKLE